MSDDQPTPGTKADLERQVRELTADNERLRGQLAAAGASRTVAHAPRRPFLSEGERAELEMYGVATSPFTGEQLDTETERARLAESDTQANVEIGDADPDVARAAGVDQRDRADVVGLDYIPADNDK